MYPPVTPAAPCVPLRAASQVRAFSGAVHVGLGGSLSVAMGPLGRSADATVLVGPHVLR